MTNRDLEAPPSVLLDPNETTPTDRVSPLTEAFRNRWIHECPPGHCNQPNYDLRELSHRDLGVTFRHSGWQPRRAKIHEALCRSKASNRRLSRFENCGHHAYVVRCVEEPDRYAVIADFCNDRFCVPCARQRSRKIASALINRETVEELKFLTLTLREGAMGLGHTVDRLQKAFAKLRAHAFWKSHVRGGIAFIETHYRPDRDTWHTHMHCLVHSTYMARETLSHLWKRITGDSDVIDIRWPRNAANVTRYIAKYASKPIDSSFEDDQEALLQAINALNGRRLYVQFGDWKGKLLQDQDLKLGWETVCSIEDLYQAAKRREGNAIEVLSQLLHTDVEKTLEYEPPEDLQPARAPPVRTDVQLVLLDTRRLFYNQRLPATARQRRR